MSKNNTFAAAHLRVKALIATAAGIDDTGWEVVCERYSAKEGSIKRAREVVGDLLWDLFPTQAGDHEGVDSRRALTLEQNELADAALTRLPNDPPYPGMGRHGIRGVARLALQAAIEVARAGESLESDPKGQSAKKVIDALFKNVLTPAPSSLRERKPRPLPGEPRTPPKIDRVKLPRIATAKPLTAAKAAANEEALNGLIKDIKRRWKTRESWLKLGHAEQVVDLLGRILDREIENGGFDQFLVNDSGDVAETAVTYLDEAGATNTAKICRAVFSIFPDGEVPTDQEERQEFIVERCEDGWDEEANEAYQAHRAQMIAALLAYARKHRVSG
jgi:hypothetical protein